MDTNKYRQYGIEIEERGQTTHIFKDGELVGSFTINLDTKTLKFQFPDNQIFNYFAYIANDVFTNRVKWVNENLRNDSMNAVQAGVAFLGFAKFEELVAHQIGEGYGEHIH